MMDFTTTTEESCSLLSFRIRSPRAKKRALREDREKQLRKLDRELDDLHQQQRELGFVTLDPPLIRGWKRSFVLREDVARSSYAGFYQQVLDKINTIQTHHDRKFLVKKRMQGRKKQVPRKQDLRRFPAIAFNRMQWTEWERRKFHAVEHWKGETVYVFSDQWCFQLQVQPNVITKVRLQSTLVEQRMEEIRGFMERNALWGRLSRLQGRKYWWGGRSAKVDVKKLRREGVKEPKNYGGA